MMLQLDGIKGIGCSRAPLTATDYVRNQQVTVPLGAFSDAHSAPNAAFL